MVMYFNLKNLVSGMYAKINTETCKKFSPVVQSSEWRHPPWSGFFLQIKNLIVVLLHYNNNNTNIHADDETVTVES